MKISDVIEKMQELQSQGNTDIIATWYTKDNINESISNEEWAEFCDLADGKIDWSDVHEGLTDILNNP